MPSIRDRAQENEQTFCYQPWKRRKLVVEGLWLCGLPLLVDRTPIAPRSREFVVILRTETEQRPGTSDPTIQPCGHILVPEPTMPSLNKLPLDAMTCWIHNEVLISLLFSSLLFSPLFFPFLFFSFLFFREFKRRGIGMIIFIPKARNQGEFFPRKKILILSLGDLKRKTVQVRISSFW